jgi:hypothetical protein
MDMPAEGMFAITSVRLKASIEAIVSRPKVRVACASCGEEVINERTTRQDGQEVCRACAQGGYYTPVDQPSKESEVATSPHPFVESNERLSLTSPTAPRGATHLE